MRHFFARPHLGDVAPLPGGVAAASLAAPLVLRPRRPLPHPSGTPRAQRCAVAGTTEVAQRAQQDRPSTVRSITDDKVQRDHGPSDRAREEARLPREPVRPTRGRTAVPRDERGLGGGKTPGSPYFASRDRPSNSARPRAATPKLSICSGPASSARAKPAKRVPQLPPPSSPERSSQRFGDQLRPWSGFAEHRWVNPPERRRASRRGGARASRGEALDHMERPARDRRFLASAQ
jgi:hypothetical protein